jgi:tellurite resistance protein TerC
MLALDLGVFHRRPHEVSFREAGAWTAVWVLFAGAFALGLFQLHGAEIALEFVTGYLIEKALSIDNVFVFVVLFAALSIPAALQHRVLFWGILGALVLRAGFIFAGAAVLQRASFVLYVFGAILLASGLKLLLTKGESAPDPAQSRTYRLIQRLVPSTPTLAGSAFWVKQDGKRLATPLFGALVMAETTDVIFAVDSIPAIFGVTEDPFIVYTSNVFAILGLRSLYFVLASVLDRFFYLKPALALILSFIGVKLLLSHVAPIPTGVALGVIVLLLLGAVGLSLVLQRGRRSGPASSKTPTHSERNSATLRAS